MKQATFNTRVFRHLWARLLHGPILNTDFTCDGIPAWVDHHSDTRWVL
jgi:hypothetical protein